MSSSTLQFPALDAAIAAFETGGNPNSAAALANNPGAIQPGTFASQYGAVGATNVANGQQIANFPTAAQGQAAEDALVGYYANQGDTVQQLIQNWSVGPNGTPTQVTQNYVNSVVGSVPGATASTPVSQLAGVGSSSSTSGGGTSGALSSIQAALTGFSWGRVAAFLVGAVGIIGAIVLFRKD